MSRNRIHLSLLALGLVLLGTTAATAAEPKTFSDRLHALISRISGKHLPTDIFSSNGRIEAEQVLVAAKYAGRVKEMLVEEGATVEEGQAIARMDTSELDTQLTGALAQVAKAEKATLSAEAAIAQRDSELNLAKQEFERTSALVQKGFATTQQLDQRRSQQSVAEAADRAAHAGRDEANAATDAARAEVAHIQSMRADAELKAPRRGRIEYKLVKTGEVVAAGAPVATLLDLGDVYMTVFVPARVAGKLSMGDEARMVLDPVPDYVVPVTVSFVATEAQFTPKQVETADERDKLMFRVKLKVAPALLHRFEARVKTGVRGLAYLRTSPKADWPAELAPKLPQ